MLAGTSTQKVKIPEELPQDLLKIVLAFLTIPQATTLSTSSKKVGNLFNDKLWFDVFRKELPCLKFNPEIPYKSDKSFFFKAILQNKSTTALAKKPRAEAVPYPEAINNERNLSLFSDTLSISPSLIFCTLCKSTQRSELNTLLFLEFLQNDALYTLRVLFEKTQRNYVVKAEYLDQKTASAYKGSSYITVNATFNPKTNLDDMEIQISAAINTKIEGSLDEWIKNFTSQFLATNLRESSPAEKIAHCLEELRALDPSSSKCLVM